MTDVEQHLMLAFEGHELPASLLERVATAPPAGVTLFAANVRTPEHTRELTDRLQAARPPGTPPLLVAADQEGGQLIGLGPATTPFAGNLALGAVGDEDLARRVGAAMGRELRAVGVNVDYAPDCDLATDPLAVAVGLRSFGDEATRAGALAAAFVRGLQDAGVAATAKHFPGSGSVRADTHHGIGTVEVARDLLDRRELAVFRAAIGAGVSLVMTGHVAVPAVTGSEELPSTLSQQMVTGLLRRELGYRGVVITDALDMSALAQGDGQLIDVITALRAGVDLLLCPPDAAANTRLIAGLRHAAARGLLPPDDLEGSARRVRRLRLGIPDDDQPPLSVVGCRDHRDLAEELARRAITLVRADDTLPLKSDTAGEVLVLEPRPRDVTPADTTSRVEPTLAAALRERLPRVDGVVYDDPPQESDVVAVAERARDADTVVLGTSNGLFVPSQRRLAEAVLRSGTTTIHVALRSPLDVGLLDEAATALCTYGIHAPSTRALADVLTGRAPAPGRLPVRLDGPPRVLDGGVA